MLGRQWVPCPLPATLSCGLAWPECRLSTQSISHTEGRVLRDVGGRWLWQEGGGHTVFFLRVMKISHKTLGAEEQKWTSVENGYISTIWSISEIENLLCNWCAYLVRSLFFVLFCFVFFSRPDSKLMTYFKMIAVYDRRKFGKISIWMRLANSSVCLFNYQNIWKASAPLLSRVRYHFLHRNRISFIRGTYAVLDAILRAVCT